MLLSGDTDDITSQSQPAYGPAHVDSKLRKWREGAGDGAGKGDEKQGRLRLGRLWEDKERRRLG